MGKLVLLPEPEINRLLTSISRELVCLHSSEGLYLYVSPSSEKIIGYKPEELLGKNPYDFFHPEDRVKVRLSSHHPLLEGETNLISEYRFLHKNGNYIWLQTVSALIQDQSVTKIHTSSIDISSQIEFRETFLQNERLLREMSNLANVGGWEFDTTLMKSTWTDLVFQIHDLEPPNIPKDLDTSLSYYPAPGDSILRQKMWDVFEKGIPFDLTLPFISAKKKSKWVRLIANPEIVNGKAIRVYGAIYDVTEQTNAEHRLEISEKKFRDAFHFSAVGVVLTSTDGKFLEVNSAFCRFIGYSQEELLGKEISSISFEGDLTLNHRLRDQVLEGKSDFFEMEKRYIHKDGRILWGHLSGTLVRDEKGHPIHFVSQIFDIDSRKKTELKLLQTNEKLTTVTNSLTNQNKQLQSYNQIVSHNLRSPVSNLRTLLNLMDETEDEEEKKEYNIHLHKVTENLESTLEDLITALKIQQSQENQPQSLDLQDSLERVKKLMMGEITNLKADIRSDFAPAPEIYFPKMYLESILLNLLSNSLKYSKPDIKPQVQIHSFPVGNQITISFSDNGLGIDLERYGKHLFQLRKTFHRHISGRGLGLFLTKYQLESVGGQIEVRSEPGLGSTFLLHFPKKVTQE